ncbi:hypothetical protein H4R18_002866 [Coemansia javaensis]|uniref:Molybdopterin synthase sulfur carrier subunit n=1 Tax=Coemansia javaensis TaxID=2761396 RepID=A0A9W8HFG6_9FUNG|nr:hypothetical protein H4R18_002866 [Coemansia javaensis]
MVRVVYFASASEAAETKSDEFELGSGDGGRPPVLSDVLSHVEALHSKLGTVIRTSLISINNEYCAGEHSQTPVCDADEVAIIPPVSGG